ncbi:MAG: sugar nucleotide-binding protein [Pseudomonadota bacterium]|nr:sugar nucleotide-binding protein [Pseudomonadota bacterium]
MFGTYHLAAAGETSWHGYAQFVVKTAAELGMALKVQADAIAPIGTADYPLPAARPANSRLCTAKLQAAFGIALPAWQDGVADVINQLVK